MDRIQWFPNERVQLDDFELATGKLVMQDNARAVRSLVLPRGRSTTGAAHTEARILAGFGASVPGGLGVGSTLTIGSGRAVLGWLDKTQFYFGLVHGEVPPDSYTLDMGSTSSGLYSVYVRWVAADADQGNRVFWNPAAVPPAEEVDTVYTEKVGTWEAVVQVSTLAPPGNGEWVHIWDVTISAGPVISALADMRHFFFEGSAATTDGPYEFEWGDGTNDRDANRAAYGLGDLHLWGQMVKRQLGEIINHGSNVAHVKKPLIDLESLALEHYGPETGAALGRHKQVTLREETLGTRIVLTSSLDALASSFNIFASDITPSTPVRRMQFLDDGSNRLSIEKIDARGSGLAFAAVGDAAITSYFGDDYRETVELTAGGQGERSSKWMGTTELTLHMGTGVTDRGLVAEQGKVYAKNGFGLYEEKTVQVVIPLQWAADVRTTANGWVMFSDSSPLDSPAYLYNCQKLAAATKFFIHLPHLAELKAIYIMWEQNGATGSGEDMRLYAQKHSMGFTAIGEKPALDDTTIYKNLNASQQYIEWGAGVSSNCEIKKFTANNPTTSARIFDQHEDMLVVTVVGATDEAKDCSIYWIQVEFAYTHPQPFPVD